MKVRLHTYHFILLFLFSNYFSTKQIQVPDDAGSESLASLDPKASKLMDRFLTNALEKKTVQELSAIESDVVFWLSGATSLCGEEFCVTVRVKDFAAISEFGFSLNWNPALLGFKSSNLLDTELLNGANFNETEVNTGKFGFSWQDDGSNPNGLDLDRDQAIINICLEDMLSVDQSVPIDFADEPVSRSITSPIEDIVNFVSIDTRATLECDDPCKANFSFSVLDSCGSVQFFNESAGDSLMYTWNFDDGTLSNQENPNHTYNSTKAGGFDVTLSVAGTSNCQDMITQNLVITGQDATAPIIICPKDTAVDCTTPLIPANTGELIIMDNCGINDIEITFNDEVTTEATCSRVIKRTWAVVDKSNNIETCVQIISVIDESGPEINNCPQGIAVNNDPGDCGALVNVVPPIATDGCNQVLSLTNDFTNNATATDFYPVGTTIVTWSALDNCGNVTATCSHSIVVMDNEPQVFNVQ